MARLSREVPSFAPSTPKEENNDDSYSYSFAAEYCRSPVAHEIPRALPVNTSKIPVADKIASASLSKDVLLPIIQPFVKSASSNKKFSKEPKSGTNGILNGKDAPSELSNREDISSRLALANGIECGSKSSYAVASSGRLEFANGDKCGSKLSDDIQSSGKWGLCSESNSSRELSGNSHMWKLCDHIEYANIGKSYQDYMTESYNRIYESIQSDLSSCSTSSETFSGKEDDCVEGDLCHVRTPSTETCRDPDFSDVFEEESDRFEVESNIPARQMAARPGKKGTCYRCLKGNRFTEKEICIVCGAKYCYRCVLRAMGSMPEGRKCVTCIGQKIDEARRKTLGRCSRMLKQLLFELEVKQVMVSERSCEVNQLPPELVYVNRRHLSKKELFLLQTCPYPPKKLKPGFYWYDKFSGFWGKEGQKPCQIISPELNVGGYLQRDASNGNTNILINNREINKPEISMLKLMGMKLNCKRTTQFWVSADGSYQEEGMNQVRKIWETNRAKFFCAVFFLPIPPVSAGPSVTPPGFASHTVEGVKSVDLKRLEKKKLYELPVGFGKSGTSTIFKQGCKVFFACRPRNPWSEDETLRLPNLKNFSFNELKTATEDFIQDNVLKEFVHVIFFKGWIDEHFLTPIKPRSGMAIAVKWFRQNSERVHKKWLAEIKYLRQLQHPNIIKLIGYCFEGDRRLLIFEFMPYGSLADHLFNRDFQPLPWGIRMKVVLDAAKGLAFLHSTDVNVVHRDIRSSTILLDSNHNAKLSNFGLAKVGPTDGNSVFSSKVVGTARCISPEYHQTGTWSAKCDVYSFGVTLIEILSGRPFIDDGSWEQKRLVEWKKNLAEDRTKKSRVHRILDASLDGRHFLRMAERLANLALHCLNNDPNFRPDMADVVMALEELQENMKENENMEFIYTSCMDLSIH